MQDTVICWCLGSAFSKYCLRCLPSTKDFDAGFINSDEHFIGILCFCDKNNPHIVCSELLLYFTRHKSYSTLYNALGVHSITHEGHEGKGLNTMLRQIAICCLPHIQNVFKDKVDITKPFYIGSEAVNPVSLHIMQNHLGCSTKGPVSYRINMGKLIDTCHIRRVFGKDITSIHVEQLNRCFKHIFGMVHQPLHLIDFHKHVKKIERHRLLRKHFQSSQDHFKSQYGEHLLKIHMEKNPTYIRKHTDTLCCKSHFNVVGHADDVLAFVKTKIEPSLRLPYTCFQLVIEPYIQKHICLIQTNTCNSSNGQH